MELFLLLALNTLNRISYEIFYQHYKKIYDSVNNPVKKRPDFFHEDDKWWFNLILLHTIIVVTLLMTCKFCFNHKPSPSSPWWSAGNNTQITAIGILCQIRSVFSRNNRHRDNFVSVLFVGNCDKNTVAYLCIKCRCKNCVRIVRIKPLRKR